MPTMLKRRKIYDGPSTKLAFIKDISTFAKVSKASNAQQFLYKKDDNYQDSDEERRHKAVHRAVKSKKRQREAEEEGTPDQGLKEQSGNILRVALDQDPIYKTPKKKARFARTENKLLETPTKAARSLLESFTISHPKAKESCNPEIQDLIDLHDAFLNALAILYAHNGTASPIEIKTLIPQIERKWGKRRITIEDIQQTLGIQHYNNPKSPLSLVQRSLSRICIEYNTTSSASTTLRIEPLKRQFLTTITSHPSSSIPLQQITLHTSPFETTTDNPISKGALRLREIKATALAAQPQSQNQFQSLPTRSKPNSQTPEISTPTPSHRATSLLDRILQKQTLASTAPAPPSAEILARRACLQRLEEIIPILEVLSGTSPPSSSSSSSSANATHSSSSADSLSSLLASDLNLGRGLGLSGGSNGGGGGGLGSLGSLGSLRSPPVKVVSFTMGSLVQHLRGSMRHPMAKEEVERAVRLLADEVASRWVSVMGVGNVVGVTFRGSPGGGRGEWRGRVGEMLAQD